jgi:hypothetical protein
MVVVFDGLVSTSYSQLTLTSGTGDPASPDEAFVGQSNGLAGGAVDGALFLVVGTHTGSIPVRVVVHDAPPPLGDWEEIVEVGFAPASPVAFLSGWAEDPSARFDLTAPEYRARWSAAGMDAAHDRVADETTPALDRYELALWPEPASPDAIVRRTGPRAAYWHDAGFFRG